MSSQSFGARFACRVVDPRFGAPVLARRNVHLAMAERIFARPGPAGLIHFMRQKPLANRHAAWPRFGRWKGSQRIGAFHGVKPYERLGIASARIALRKHDPWNWHRI